MFPFCLFSVCAPPHLTPLLPVPAVLVASFCVTLPLWLAIVADAVALGVVLGLGLTLLAPLERQAWRSPPPTPPSPCPQDPLRTSSVWLCSLPGVLISVSVNHRARLEEKHALVLKHNFCFNFFSLFRKIQHKHPQMSSSDFQDCFKALFPPLFVPQFQPGDI